MGGRSVCVAPNNEWLAGMGMSWGMSQAGLTDQFVMIVMALAVLLFLWSP
jgi:hypothetical protein